MVVAYILGILTIPTLLILYLGLLKIINKIYKFYVQPLQAIFIYGEFLRAYKYVERQRVLLTISTSDDRAIAAKRVIIKYESIALPFYKSMKELLQSKSI